MKDYRKESLKAALRISHEFNSKTSLEDLLETHSWVLMQGGCNPYAGSRVAKKIIAVYEVGRAYGGPEEGGWWYDCYELAYTVPFSRKALIAVEKDCYEESRYIRYGYYTARVEYGEGGEHETRERPIYE